MALRLPTALRNSRGDAVTSLAGNGALLRIYAGTIPTDANTAIGAQTLLGTLTCGSPFAAAASGGVVTANAITQDSAADATGTAAFFRLFASNGTTVVMDGTVGTSGADLNLTTVSVTSGQPIQVTSFVLTEGGA